MKSKENNFAYIDGANLHKNIVFLERFKDRLEYVANNKNNIK